MPRTKKPEPEQLNLLEARTSTAPCVPEIRKAVEAWRLDGYKGVTPTTRTLLNYWFKSDHRLRNGRRFAYHPAQREAVETLIYLFEVAKVRRQKSMIETYYKGTQNLQLSQHDDFPRYCVKMATGSGKTKVMSLAIAWQLLNAQLEPNGDEYARTFLVLAPNVIVYERLRTDFGSGRVFRVDPVIPPEFAIFWDFDVYLRGEGGERAATEGALYLTNIQQLHERRTGAGTDDDEEDPIGAMLGPKPPTQKIETVDFAERIAARGGNCMVVNDEAHHTHDEKLKWNEIIRDLHGVLAEEGGSALQLDVTATPRYNKGGLFTWTVFDYPLKQAIIDGIVKRPVKGMTTGLKEAQSDVASTRYQAYLVAGVERWREYRDQLQPLGKKPLMFVMMDNTAEADDVADFLRHKYPSDFGDKRLLVIHTDKSGEVSKKDLDAAREVARNADDAENPVNAIVSVLMLREGWDVENVTVVVGLRPYSSKANILPEQTIGRGLRLMFRDRNSVYTERVDIIGNKKFIEFIDELERDEDLTLETFEVGKDKLEIVVVAPDPAKVDRDIALPKLTPILARKKTLAEEIAALDVASFSCPPLPRKENDEAAKVFQYEGRDIITLEKLIERSYEIPRAQTSQEVISYYAKRIAQDVKLPSQFAALVPKVREFLETRAFGGPVTLDSPAMILAISSNVAAYVTIRIFAGALRSLVVEEKTPELESAGRLLSETQPFPFSRPTKFAATKTIFNWVAPDNDFERRFAAFLEDAEDVSAFAKLPSQFGFAIEYTDNATNLRYYEPDFVAVLQDGTRFLLETKGREDIDVAHKDRAAHIWCENATLLTGTVWEYRKIPQAEFDKLRPDQFADLCAFAT
jgi:type III restriction enzyme